MALRGDLVGVPDALVEQHVEVTAAQGAQAQPGLDDGVATRMGIGDHGLAQGEDGQALALAGFAGGEEEVDFSDCIGNVLRDAHG